MPKNEPFVLKPYAPQAPTMGRRIFGWVGLPLLVLTCLLYGFFYALTTPYLLPQFAAPVLILAAFAVWALPDMRVAPTRTLEYLFFAFIVAALLWPNYIAIAPPGLPWITMIRLIGLPFVFVLLICVSISPRFRAETKASVTSIPYLMPVFLSFLVIQTVSIGFSNSIGDSLNQYVSAQTNWTAMFFAGAYLFLKRGNVEKFAALLWAAALVLAVLGVWEQRLEHVPWAGHIPSFLKVDAEYMDKVLSGQHRLGSDKYRVQGTHSTSLGLAEFLAMTTPFLIHFVMERYPRQIRIAAAVSIPIVLYTIISTDARLGSVGFLISVLLYGLSWAYQHWRANKNSIVGPALLVSAPIAAAVGLAATFFIGRLHVMVWGGGQDTYSTQGRIDQMHQGIPKILKHPWGYGIGRGAETLDYHNLGGVLTIDTYFLLIALEYGVIGFLLYYGSILLSAGFAAKVSHFERIEAREDSMLIPVGISLVVFFVIKSIFSQTENHYLQFILMGAACALIYRVRNKPGGTPAPA
jgi:hypothetical protein